MKGSTVQSKSASQKKKYIIYFFTLVQEILDNAYEEKSGLPIWMLVMSKFVETYNCPEIEKQEVLDLVD